MKRDIEPTIKCGCGQLHLAPEVPERPDFWLWGIVLLLVAVVVGQEVEIHYLTRALHQLNEALSAVAHAQQAMTDYLIDLQRVR